jgi:hypothetical protein
MNFIKKGWQLLDFIYDNRAIVATYLFDVVGISL